MKRTIIIAAMLLLSVLATGLLSSCNKPSEQSFMLSGGESGFSSLKRDVSSAD